MKKWVLFFCGAVLLFIISIRIDNMVGKRKTEGLVAKLDNTNINLKNSEMIGLISGLKKTAMKLNKTAPHAIDELTTFLRQEVDGLTVTSFFKLALDKNQISISDIDNFKKEIIALRCKLARLHDGYKGGIMSVHKYTDINDEPFANIVIDENVCSK